MELPHADRLAAAIRQAMEYAAIAESRCAVEARLAESDGLSLRERRIMHGASVRHARAAQLQEQSALQLMKAQGLIASFQGAPVGRRFRDGRRAHGGGGVHDARGAPQLAALSAAREPYTSRA
jgi:hypothetical protein